MDHRWLRESEGASLSPLPSPWLVLLTRMDRRHFSAQPGRRIRSKGPQTSLTKYGRWEYIIPAHLYRSPCFHVPCLRDSLQSRPMICACPFRGGTRDKQLPLRYRLPNRFENSENFLIPFHFSNRLVS